MDAIVWGLCIEGLWRGWRFDMIGMENYKIYWNEEYILSSNGNACVLLTFKKFRLVLLFQIRTIEYNLILIVSQDNVY